MKTKIILMLMAFVFIGCEKEVVLKGTDQFDYRLRGEWVSEGSNVHECNIVQLTPAVIVDFKFGGAYSLQTTAYMFTDKQIHYIGFTHTFIYDLKMHINENEKLVVSGFYKSERNPEQAYNEIYAKQK